MKHTSNDLRVRRTLKSIHEAFAELVLEEDYQNISITELTNRAEVNRKTFYLHYSSLDDLIHEIEEDTAKKILATLDEEAENLDVAGCVSKFYHYLDTASDVEKKLMCDPEYHKFYENVTDRILGSRVFQRFYDICEYPDVVRAFCVSITTIYRTWMSSYPDAKLDDIINYANTLILQGYNAVPKKKL